MLEIGCGLGLPSLVAARLGADVGRPTGPDAIALLERNAARNGLPVAAPADWRDTDAIVALGPFDLVLAADVLYEARNAAPILTLLATLGAPATIADPGRRHAAAFLDAVRADRLDDRHRDRCADPAGRDPPAVSRQAVLTASESTISPSTDVSASIASSRSCARARSVGGDARAPSAPSSVA